jgi:hypothetical protein
MEVLNVSINDSDRRQYSTAGSLTGLTVTSTTGTSLESLPTRVGSGAALTYVQTEVSLTPNGSETRSLSGHTNHSRIMSFGPTVQHPTTNSKPAEAAHCGSLEDGGRRKKRSLRKVVKKPGVEMQLGIPPENEFELGNQPVEMYAGENSVSETKENVGLVDEGTKHQSQKRKKSERDQYSGAHSSCTNGSQPSDTVPNGRCISPNIVVPDSSTFRLPFEHSI